MSQKAAETQLPTAPDPNTAAASVVGSTTGTPTTAEPAAATPTENREATLAAMVSSVAPLPKSVPELILVHERLYVRCEEMKALLDALRMEASHLAASSPSAGAALGDLLATIADSEGPSVVAPDGTLKRVTGSSPAAASTSPQITPEGTPGKFFGALLSTPAAGNGSSPIVSRAVVAGKVVSAGRGTPVPGTAVAADDATTRGRLTRFVDFKRDFREECNVLRAQLIAMGAAQQLLAVVRDQLRESEREGRDAQAELKAVKTLLLSETENTARLECALCGEGFGSTDSNSNASGSPALELSEARRRCAALRAEVEAIRARLEASEYQEAQLAATHGEQGKALAFANEKNAHLEGQLQRLLTAQSDDALEQIPNARGEAPTAAPPTAVAAPPPLQQPPAAPATSSDSYTRNAMEKQVVDLRAMVERTHRRTEANTEKRRRLEAAVAELAAENKDLKASVLQYRRQVNESELDLERQAAVQADADRAVSLEKEIVRLRNALRERKEELDGAKQGFQSSSDDLHQRLEVFEASTAHLQRELLRCQLRIIITSQTTASTRSSKPSAGARAPTPTPGAHRSTAARSPSGQQDGNALFPPSATAMASSTSARTFGSAAGFGSPVLQQNREALEEMRSLYERRMETLEAQKRAEVKQVQNLNRELRQALAASQEEVHEKDRLLDMARAQPAATSGAATPLWGAPVSRAPSFHRAGHADDGSSLDPLNPHHHQRFLSAEPPAVTASRRSLSEIEQHYDPENMSVWEAVQLENEALLRRVSCLQEEKWSADNAAEVLQRQKAVVERELERTAAKMNQLVQAGVMSPAALHKGQDEGRLRSLQCLLQNTLTEKMALEDQVERLKERLERGS